VHLEPPSLMSFIRKSAIGLEQDDNNIITNDVESSLSEINHYFHSHFVYHGTAINLQSPMLLGMARMHTERPEQ
jgi:hypothetical protein